MYVRGEGGSVRGGGVWTGYFVILSSIEDMSKQLLPLHQVVSKSILSKYMDIVKHLENNRQCKIMLIGGFYSQLANSV